MGDFEGKNGARAPAGATASSAAALGDDASGADALLRTVFDASPVPMLILDEGCVIRQVNAAAAALGGGAGAMVGKRVGEAVGCRYHLEASKGCGFESVCARCPLWQSIQDTARTGECRAGVAMAMELGSAAARELRYLALSTALLPAWRPRLVLVCLEDITAVRQAEEAWRKSAEKFSSVFHLSPDAINLNRLSDGVFLEVNEVFTRMLGYTRDEVIGRSSLAGDLNIWGKKAERERWVATLRSAGQIIGYDVEVRRKDGTKMSGVMSARRIDIDGEECVLVVTRDMTEHKMTKEALRSHRRRLAAAMDMAHLAYWDCNNETRIFTFNDQFYALYGTTAEREGGYQMSQEAYIGAFVHPEDAHGVVEEMVRGMASEDPNYQHQLEHRIIRRDGAIRHIAVRIHAVKDAAGRMIHAHGINQDITERVLLEEQLRQAQKMEAIGRLAGGIAHDFRNHLTVIRGFGELLRENEDLGRSDERLLDEILKAAEQSTHLTEQLLLFSRKQTLRPKTLDVGELTAQICAILPRLVGDDIKVAFTREGGSARAMLDPVQFQQAVFNLAANARDAMPQGGELSLRCHVVAPDAAFRERHLGAEAARYIALRVTDTGQGIDEATLGRIFEPFFTTKAVGKGTGLGLASVYGFVNQSGGIVDVRSQPGKGTTFLLYFPLVDGAEVAAPAPATGDQLPGGDERVLIVEDDASLCELVQKFLRAAGYRTVVAADSEAALACLGNQGEVVDLLLTDVIMPGGSGVALAVRAGEMRPGLPVVLMSGYAEKELMDRGLKESHGAFLSKPFGRGELLQMVRRALDERGEK